MDGAFLYGAHMECLMLKLDFFQQPTLCLARDLLGRFLKCRTSGKLVTCRIVEVEAYHQEGDAAAHSFKGPSQRNRVMFGPAGHLYVYFIYGMHYCMNLVSEPEGVGAAVLIRALEPIHGEEVLMANRGANVSRRNLSNGPARCCAALTINSQYNGISLLGDLLWLEAGEPVGPGQVVETTRIGISKSVDLPWRFYVKDHADVSRK